MSENATAVESSQRPVGETLNLEQAEARLEALFVIPPEVVERGRETVTAVSEVLVRAAATPMERKSLTFARDEIVWSLFTASDAPLPNVLAWDVDSTRIPQVTPNVNVGYCEHCSLEATRTITEVPVVEALADEIKQIYNDRKDDIADATKTLVKELPLSKFIETFDDTLLEPESVALSETERAIRQSQLARSVLAAVQQDRGLRQGDTMRIPKGTGHEIVYKRGLQRLDDETKTVMRAEPLSGFTKLVNYTKQAMAEALVEDGLESPVVEDLVYTPRSLEQRNDPDDPDYGKPLHAMMVRHTVAGERITEMIDATEINTTFSEILAERHKAAGSHLQDSLTYEAAFTLLTTVIEHAQSPSEISDILEEVATEISEDMISEIDWNQPNRHDTMPSAIRSSPGPVLKYAALSELHRERHAQSPDSIGITSVQEMIRKSKTLIARMHHQPTGVEFGRLIQTMPVTEDTGTLPATGPNDDMQITFYTDTFDGAELPYIPGYKLSSRSYDTFGFTYDPNADPYAEARTLLPTDKVAQLHETYLQAGMTEIAAALASLDEVTVSDLTAIIRNNSVYPMPHGASDTDYYRSSISDIADFSRVVQDGKPVIQCNGSALLLRMSLQQVFGATSSTVVGGFVIGTSANITRRGHAQTSFTHDGHVYILDATPPSTDFDSQRALSDATDRATAPEATDYVPPAITQRHESYYKPGNEALTPEELLTRIRGNLYISLMAYFDSQDVSEAQHKIVSLGTDDPIRRTVSLLHTADPRSTDVIGDITATLTFLQNYSEADRELLRQSRLPRYSPRAVKLLQNALTDLKSGLTKAA